MRHFKIFSVVLASFLSLGSMTAYAQSHYATKQAQESYDNAIKLLIRIADGEQDIGVAPDEPVTETGFSVASKVDGGPAMFSLSSMRF